MRWTFEGLIRSMDAEVFMDWIGQRGLDEVVEGHIREDFEGQDRDGKAELMRALDLEIKKENRRKQAIKRAIEYYTKQKQRNSAIERAEKAEAKLKEVREWNENNKPVYPIVDMVGEVKHMRYTALREILGDAK